jgi:hypothetical protein
MKIFAKRTGGGGSSSKEKKSKDTPSTSNEPRTVFQSDPIVEALLGNDPSTWNSKERRLVKRYRERNNLSEDAVLVNSHTTSQVKPETKGTDDTAKVAEVSVTDTNQSVEANDRTESRKEENEDGEKDSDEEEGQKSSDCRAAGGSSSPESTTGDGNFVGNEEDAEDQNDIDMDTTDRCKEQQTPEEDGKSISLGEKEIVDAPMTTTDDIGDDAMQKVDNGHEIWTLLNQLNSKQKRTLSRKLDRMGKAALDEVREEAKQLLDGDNQTAKDSIVSSGQAESTGSASKKRLLQDAGSDKNDASQSSKKQKSQKTADWSHLPTEERLRREEQRRKQVEAAERRERGEDLTSSGHKHPLNSQRRRANRRKPKWKKPTSLKGAIKNEHNSSGYLMRRTVGGDGS